MINKMLSANGTSSTPYTFKHPISRLDDVDGVPRMMVTQAGNTGIGTLIPDQKLTLAEQDKRVDNVGILFRSSMSATGLVEDTMRIRSGWHNARNDRRNRNKALSIEGRTTDVDNIAGWREIIAARSDGNVGISVSAPSERLHVVGNTYTEGRVVIGPPKPEFEPNGGSKGGVDEEERLDHSALVHVARVEATRRSLPWPPLPSCRVFHSLYHLLLTSLPRLPTDSLEERFAMEVSRAAAQQEPLAAASVGEDEFVRKAHASRYAGKPSGIGDLEFLDTNNEPYLTVSATGCVLHQTTDGRKPIPSKTHPPRHLLHSVVGFTHPTSNVGVGTNNPIHPLHVRGTEYLDGALLIRAGGNYEPLDGGVTRHRTNFSFVAGNETGNLEVRDYEGTSAFTMTPNGTIWLSSDHADLCSRSASNLSICNGRFIGIGTKE